MMSSLLFTSIALAAPNSSSSTPASTPDADVDADAAALRGRDGGSQRYVFESDDVEGERAEPASEVLRSRTRRHHPSLLRIRPHFLPELVRLALDVER